MNRVIRYFLLLIWIPLAAMAQEEEKKGGLEGLLERSLSSDAMEVTIDGLDGALSSTASIEKLTFADPGGPWMIIENAQLNWTRSALLLGRVKVKELAAERITVLRSPAGGEEEPELPSAEAEPFQFSLPELPVSIEVETISATEIILEEDLVGERVVATLAGGFRLADGDGAINLNLVRTDEVGTHLEIGMSFENSSEELVVLLEAQGREDGLLSRKSGIPGAPELALSVVGRGLLSDFTADVNLASDDTTRLGGVVRLLASPLEEGATRPDRTIQALLSGDVRALVTDDLQPFFGNATSLDFETILTGSGAVEVPRLHLKTSQLNVRSRLSLGDTKWPERIALFARLDAGDGQPVRLPVPGTPTELSSAYVNLSFDQSEGSIWSAVVTLSDLQQGDLELETIDLRGAGELEIPQEDGIGGISGQISGGTVGLSLPDAALQEAAGDAIAFGTAFSWQKGQPLQIDGAEVAAGDVALTLSGLFSNLATGLDFSGSVGLDAPDLSRFSALSGQSLTGAVEMDLSGDATLLGGIFDLTATGTGRGLQTGIAEADALLGGEAELAFDVARDTTGITIREAAIRTEALDFRASGGGSRTATDLTLSARLDDVGRVLPDLTGPADLSGSVRNEDGGFRVGTELTSPNVDMKVDGLLSDLAGDIGFDGSIALEADDLSQFAAITGQDIAGSVDLGIDGTVTVKPVLFDLKIDGSGDGLRTGIAEADALIGGNLIIALDGARTSDSITLRKAEISSNAINLRVDPGDRDTEIDLVLNAELDDLGRVLPDLPGPAQLQGTVYGDLESLQLDTALSAPAVEMAIAGLLSDLRDDVGFDGAITLNASDLGRFRGLTGQDLAGAIDLDIEGTATIKSALFDLDVRGSGSGVQTGIPQADALLGGTLDLSLDAARTAEGVAIREATVTTEALDLRVDGAGNPEAGDLNVGARLDNLARLLPQFPGPLEVTGTARNSAGTLDIDVSGSGPAGLTLDVGGNLQRDLSQADLSVQGGARLDLISAFINPRTASGAVRWDATIRGPLGLDAVSGTVTLSDARIADPIIGFALTQLGGSAQLSSGTLGLDFGGRGNRGGRVALGGSLGLTGAQNAALDVTLENLVFAIQGAVQTQLDGAIGLDGPLTGGALLSGQIDVDETEIRIPDGAAAASDIDGLRHEGLPTPVRQTLDRAGMINDDPAPPASGGAGPALNLDLQVDAPTKIFVRGFGLDAELGGSVTVTGSTNDPRPVGEFELIRGRMSILGQRLELTEGEILLTPNLIPDIRFVASRESGEYEVSAVISGPADEPEVTFESTPPLPEDEALSRLLFQSEVASLSALQAIQLANSLVAVRNGTGVGFFNSLREEAGLDDLDLRTDEEGRTSLSLGKYISDDVYTNVDINDEGETDINLNIELTDSITARATAGTDNSSLGLFFEQDY